MQRQILYSGEKTCGLLLGTFIGDALGLPFEGVFPVDEVTLMTSLQKIYSEQRYSDDTQMTISVFEEMVQNGTIDPESLKNRFLNRFDPERGYGAGISRLVNSWRAGIDALSASQAQFNGLGSYGNGAAMRVAPVSLFFTLNETKELFKMVTLSASVTHSHILGIQGAQLQAFMVLLALNDIPENEWYSRITELAFDDIFRRKIGQVNACLGQDLSAIEAAERIGNGIVAHEAVPAALYAYLKKPFSIRESIISALLLGGDTDTIAAMAGAVAGAKYGYSGIPKEWFTILENSSEGKDFIIQMVVDYFSQGKT